MSRRWNRVLHTTPSLWRCYELSASPMVLTPGRLWWSVEEQEAWLAAKLRQLQRVSPAVRSLVLGDTVGTDVMPEALQSLTASQLTYIEASEYDVPLPAAAMRALARLTRLQEIVFERDEHPLPSNAGWALGRLTALRQLDLVSQHFPADLTSSLARLPHLSSLCLCSTQALPAVQPLTALRKLRSLILKEERSGGGLTVLPATAFPGATNLHFTSPLLKVRFAEWAALPNGVPMLRNVELFQASPCLAPASQPASRIAAGPSQLPPHQSLAAMPGLGLAPHKAGIGVHAVD